MNQTGKLNPECLIDADGNCQHIKVEKLENGGRVLSTIPFGIHTFGGRTVSVNSSSGSQVTNPQLVADQRDQLADDLLEIIRSSTHHGQADELELMQGLVMYLGERDQRILRHGVNLGKRDFTEIEMAIKLLKGWLEVSAKATSNPKIAELHRRSQDYVENV